MKQNIKKTRIKALSINKYNCKEDEDFKEVVEKLKSLEE